MNLLIERVDIWSATVDDRIGGLAGLLATLRDAGADLQFILARRSPENPNKGVVFVTPLRGDREIRAASTVGFAVSQALHSVCVTGKDRAGLAADITQRLAEAKINLRGFSASVIGTQFVAYVALDSLADADRAIAALSKG